ncbi:MAG: SymE family type I addiction module toxin [Bacteroidetes bacterium]|nr:SymE family type I addiction module toxin [Bacteroidota bacterium]
MSNIQSSRSLKICYGYYPKVRNRHPVLRIKGHYLSAFGFNIGDVVELYITQNKITIRKKQLKPH